MGFTVRVDENTGRQVEDLASQLPLGRGQIARLLLRAGLRAFEQGGAAALLQGAE